MAKLTIHRKGHTRKAFTTKRGDENWKKVRVAKTQVKPSTFKINPTLIDLMQEYPYKGMLPKGSEEKVNISIY